MSNSKLWAGIVITLSSLLFTACSNGDAKADVDTIEAEATDEMIFSVVETNVERLMAQDLDGYMETIHSDSPVYTTTEKTITDFFNYTLEIELQDLVVKEKSDEEVVVSYTQRTVDAGGGDFQNNETDGEHTLRLDDGQWKIYHSEVIAMTPCLKKSGGLNKEAIEMTGEYAEKLASLAQPFDHEEWVLKKYEEDEGAATAAFLQKDENMGNYSQIITYDFYEDGDEHSDLAHFIGVFEQSLKEMATGDVGFERFDALETEVFYQFNVTGDPTEPDQEEIGRIFILEDDIYVVRYTVMDGNIENREEIVSKLRDI